jgi:ribokinase
VAEVAVVGQIARDLVLVVDGVPGPGGTVPVRQRREMLGGKGANQAVAFAQLGMTVALVGVVGDDGTGQWLLAQARRDGIDVTHIVRRNDCASGLIVDIVTGGAAPDGPGAGSTGPGSTPDRGKWRYLEDLPPAVLLGERDIAAAAPALAAADWVCVQLQQPPGAALAAARHARRGGARVVLDGAPPGEYRRDLLGCADVVRADAREAELLAGAPLRGPADVVRAAAGLAREGPAVVALAAGGAGNVVAWPGGQVLVPLTRTQVRDTTGAGDAFTAALTAALARGRSPEAAAHLATAAAGATVGHPGGRPDLSPRALLDQLDEFDGLRG